jgi:hypothetical protein
VNLNGVAHFTKGGRCHEAAGRSLVSSGRATEDDEPLPVGEVRPPKLVASLVETDEYHFAMG